MGRVHALYARDLALIPAYDWSQALILSSQPQALPGMVPKQKVKSVEQKVSKGRVRQPERVSLGIKEVALYTVKSNLIPTTICGPLSTTRSTLPPPHQKKSKGPQYKGCRFVVYECWVSVLQDGMWHVTTLHTTDLYNEKMTKKNQRDSLQIGCLHCIRPILIQSPAPCSY